MNGNAATQIFALPFYLNTVHQRHGSTPPLFDANKSNCLKFVYPMKTGMTRSAER